MIKLKDKIKIRHMMKKEHLLFHVMLNKGLHGSHWLPTIKKLYKIVEIIFQMACVLTPQCNFLYGFFWCQLPEDTIDVEVKVITMKGIPMFRRECSTKIISCKPWTPNHCPYPSL